MDMLAITGAKKVCAVGATLPELHLVLGPSTHSGRFDMVTFIRDHCAFRVVDKLDDTLCVLANEGPVYHSMRVDKFSKGPYWIGMKDGKRLRYKYFMWWKAPDNGEEPLVRASFCFNGIGNIGHGLFRRSDVQLWIKKRRLPLEVTDSGVVRYTGDEKAIRERHIYSAVRYSTFGVMYQWRAFDMGHTSKRCGGLVSGC